MNNWEERAKTREKKYGKKKFVVHSKPGGFPVSVWIKRELEKQKGQKAPKDTRKVVTEHVIVSDRSAKSRKGR